MKLYDLYDFGERIKDKGEQIKDKLSRGIFSISMWNKKVFYDRKHTPAVVTRKLDLKNLRNPNSSCGVLDPFMPELGQNIFYDFTLLFFRPNNYREMLAEACIVPTGKLLRYYHDKNNKFLSLIFDKKTMDLPYFKKDFFHKGDPFENNPEIDEKDISGRKTFVKFASNNNFDKLMQKILLDTKSTSGFRKHYIVQKFSKKWFYTPGCLELNPILNFCRFLSVWGKDTFYSNDEKNCFSEIHSWDRFFYYTPSNYSNENSYENSNENSYDLKPDYIKTAEEKEKEKFEIPSSTSPLWEIDVTTLNIGWLETFVKYIPTLTPYIQLLKELKNNDPDNNFDDSSKKNSNNLSKNDSNNPPKNVLIFKINLFHEFMISTFPERYKTLLYNEEKKDGMFPTLLYSSTNPGYAHCFDNKFFWKHIYPHVDHAMNAKRSIKIRQGGENSTFFSLETEQYTFSLLTTIINHIRHFPDTFKSFIDTWFVERPHPHDMFKLKNKSPDGQSQIEQGEKNESYTYTGLELTMDFLIKNKEQLFVFKWDDKSFLEKFFEKILFPTMYQKSLGEDVFEQNKGQDANLYQSEQYEDALVIFLEMMYPEQTANQYKNLIAQTEILTPKQKEIQDKYIYNHYSDFLKTFKPEVLNKLNATTTNNSLREYVSLITGGMNIEIEQHPQHNMTY